jgi:hypothetical protein
MAILDCVPLGRRPLHFCAVGKRGEGTMRHVRRVSSPRPSLAQFESVLQFLAVLSAVLGLVSQFSDLIIQLSKNTEG